MSAYPAHQRDTQHPHELEVANSKASGPTESGNKQVQHYIQATREEVEAVIQQLRPRQWFEKAILTIFAESGCEVLTRKDVQTKFEAMTSREKDVWLYGKIRYAIWGERIKFSAPELSQLAMDVKYFGHYGGKEFDQWALVKKEEGKSHSSPRLSLRALARTQKLWTPKGTSNGTLRRLQEELAEEGQGIRSKYGWSGIIRGIEEKQNQQEAQWELEGAIKKTGILQIFDEEGMK